MRLAARLSPGLLLGSRLLARLGLTTLLLALLAVRFFIVGLLAVSGALLLLRLLAGVLLAGLALIGFAATLLGLLTGLRLLPGLGLTLRRLLAALFHLLQQLFNRSAIVRRALVLAAAAGLTGGIGIGVSLLAGRLIGIGTLLASVLAGLVLRPLSAAAHGIFLLRRAARVLPSAALLLLSALLT